MSVLPADYVVMVVYMLVVITLSVYLSNQGSSLNHFLSADRNLGVCGLAASFVAAEWGMVGMFCQDCAGKAHILQQFATAWMLFLAFLTVGVFGFASVFPRRLKAATAGAIIGLCYGAYARAVFGILMSAVYVSLLGLLLNSYSSVFGVFFGTSPGVLIVIMVSVAACYAMAGGIWSVVFNGYVQMAIFGAVIPMTAIFAMKAAGGFKTLYLGVQEASRTQILQDPSPFFADTGAVSVLTKFLVFFCAAVCFPSIIARSGSARSVKARIKGISSARSPFSPAPFSPLSSPRPPSF